MHIVLLSLALGQWIMLVVGEGVSSFFSFASCFLSLDVAVIRLIEVNGICDIHFSYPQINATTLVYSESGHCVWSGVVLIYQATFFDLLVFVLSVVGLSSQRSDSPLKRRLRTQGVVYIAVAVISYIPSMVCCLTPHSVRLSIAITRFLLFSTTPVRLDLFRRRRDSIINLPVVALILVCSIGE